MQLTNILTVALLAIGATALPNPSPNGLMERTDWWKCEGGKYNWVKWKCECPYSTKYNGSYPPIFNPSELERVGTLLPGLSRQTLSKRAC